MSPVWPDLLEMFPLRFYHNCCKAAGCLPGVRREVRFYQCYLLYSGLRRPRAYGSTSLGVMGMLGKLSIKGHKEGVDIVRVVVGHGVKTSQHCGAPYCLDGALRGQEG